MWEEAHLAEWQAEQPEHWTLLSAVELQMEEDPLPLGGASALGREVSGAMN